MTFLEKLENLRNSRTLALNSKKSLLDAQATAEEGRDFNYRYLFGYDGDIGINDLIALYYQEMYLGVGRGSTTPSLKDNLDITWKTRLELSITTAGDGSIYPDSNSDGVADKQINTYSAWLLNNGDNGIETGGIVALCTAVKNTVGSDATQTANGRGPFGSNPAAIAHAEATKGSGLNGKRTENSDVYSIGIPPDELYYVGQNGTDYPHYFNTPERTNLLAQLLTVKSGIDSYITKIEGISNTITSIDNDENQLFADMQINDESHFATNILGDPSDISALTTTLDGYQDDIDTYYAYFSQFTPSDNISDQSGYNQTTFNTNLDNVTTLMNSITSSLQNRADDVLDKSGSITQGLKKYRYFWIAENIRKPISPLLTLNGIESSLVDIEQWIDNANEALGILLNNADQYISTPVVYATCPDPLIDPKTGEIDTTRIKIIWSPIIFVPKYKIYRKDITGLSPNNDEWAETYFYLWHIKLNEETNQIRAIYYDESFNTGKLYQYRIQAYDGNSEGDASELDQIDDNFESKSLQSNCYDPINIYNITSITNGLIIASGHNIEEGDYVAIIGTSVNGYYLVDYIDPDNNIQLASTSINSGNIGQVAKAYGIIQT